MKRLLIVFSICANIILIAFVAFILSSKDFRHHYGDIIPCIPYESLGNTQSIEGWTNCLDKLNISADIVFFGNSITRNSDFQQYFPDKTIVNLGEGGDNLDDMIERVNMIKATDPKKVFIMAGINHSKHLSMDSFSNKYTSLLDAISKSSPLSKIYCQSILPLSQSAENTSHYTNNKNIQLMNGIIENICKERGLTYIDLFSLYSINGSLLQEYTIGDGIHLNQEHYQEWANEIRQYVED